jgi:uncharacterized protein (DUF433 family)
MSIDWVIGYLEYGRTLDQFLKDYPQYQREQVESAVRYAVEKMGYSASNEDSGMMGYCNLNVAA